MRGRSLMVIGFIVVGLIDYLVGLKISFFCLFEGRITYKIRFRRNFVSFFALN